MLQKYNGLHLIRQEKTDLSKYIDDVFDKLSYFRSVRQEEQSICIWKRYEFHPAHGLWLWVLELIGTCMSLFTQSLL